MFNLAVCIFQQAPVILLKEGTDTSQGIPQIVSNINACQAIADAVRTTLGPRGMDKLIVDDRGETCHFHISSFIVWDYYYILVRSSFLLLLLVFSL